MRPAALAATLSGRGEERARLLDAVRDGLNGSPRAVLVHGEAGIGKTTLARSVCEQVNLDGAEVLWGQSLRFGAVEAMYHPLVLALERWLADADEAERASVIDGLPAAALILPSLGAPPPESPSMLMTVVDALLSKVIAHGPTVLVVDDVQWADPATWDALAYLVAGFAHQQLALLTTHRDEAAGTEQFQHWLGNLRRLPGTEELTLTRLDQDATGDQIAQLLGQRPPTRLVDQVFERSRGNPYFSELLVRRGDLDSPELPDDLPDELSHALLDTWRGLSREARETSRILAIGGRPSDLRTLAAVATELGITPDESVREAVDAGVVVLGGNGAWFRHPLMADVLAESYLPGEAAPVHAAWAAHLIVPAEGIDELRRLGDLASHQLRAGYPSEAFAALLQGADLAEKLGARREAADLLARAADLSDVGPDAQDVIGRARLLERAGEACEQYGRFRDSYRLFRTARDLVPVDYDPLWSSRLSALVARYAFNLGETQTVPLHEIQRVVELSRGDPDSPQHAEALCGLANNLFWSERNDEARRVADDAVAAAHRSGDAAAISFAHGVRLHICADTDPQQADLDEALAWEHAVASGDPEDIFWAHCSKQLIASRRGDLRGARDEARSMFERGGPLGLTVYSSVFLADVLTAMGDLVEADGVVRAGLSTIGPPNSEATIRLLAGVLAVRRGALEAAHGHLARAYEMRPHLDERPECEAGAPMAEMLLAQDDAAGAFELIERVLPFNTIDPRVLDDLMVLGARAAADLVQQASDGRDQAAVRRHREALTGLMKARATLPGIAFASSCPGDTVQPARAALFAAEQGRADGVDDRVSLWRDAVAACETAGLGWEQQVSSWRLAAALVASGASGTSGTEAAELLRGVHEYAGRQGAEPLKARVEELAASARISLVAPSLPPSRSVPAAFAGLTAREAEVLAHLMANRTNAEIAQALFISEKTVSVHVSNLLRKTGTESRREVAALARRVGWGTGG
jgi:DNA-binding CsgD family transcriptional regulator/tetratricopeptide (TPR) repeat protein